MDVLVGKRGQGKTTRLINMSAAGEGIIVTATQANANRVARLAKELELDIPKPISWRDFMDPKGRGGLKGPFLLDDLDSVFSSLGIKTATLGDSFVTKLSRETKPNTQTSWAEKEVALAIQAEKDGAESMADWKYGADCFESALSAYKSLTSDHHTGMAMAITKGILNRLIDGKVLTPIEDTPDIWADVTGEFGWKDGTQHYQCSRMSSLFKKIAPDGTVTYSDVNRVVAVDVDKPDTAWQNASVTQLVDLIYPITFPYLPSSNKFKVFREEFLTELKNGDYDTVAYLYIIQPDGKKVPLNRYCKEVDGKMVAIEKAEFEERKARKVEKEKK